MTPARPIFLTIVLGLLAGLALAQAPSDLTFGELWTETADGLTFSEMAQALEGKTVRMLGYAAPQLKADPPYMIASNRQLAVCPFCESEAEVPPDIVFIKLPPRFDQPHFGGYEIIGTLELGVETDPESGFVSLVRIDAQRIQRPSR